MTNPIDSSSNLSLYHLNHPAQNKPVEAKESNLDAISQVNPWRSVTTEEVMTALTPCVFKDYLAKHGGTTPRLERWIASLTDVINARSCNMPRGTKGFAIVFGINRAYGPKKEINHVALGSFWRDGKDNLTFGLIHQDSIPEFKPGNPKPVKFNGQVFNDFDTRKHFPDNKAPVLEAILSFGLPSIMVTHCPNPERIVDLYKMMTDTSHPYGAFGERDKNGMAPLTCFSVTYSAFNALYNDEAFMDTRSTVPHIAKDMSKKGIIGGTNYEQLQTFQYKDKRYDFESPNLNPRESIAAFLNFASKWGLHEDATPPWDIVDRPDEKARL